MSADLNGDRIVSSSRNITVTPDEIVLAAGGAGWMGTYGLLVKALFDDILSDGAPVHAYIEHHDGDRSHTGSVTKVSETTVTFEDGFKMSIEDITLVRV